MSTRELAALVEGTPEGPEAVFRGCGIDTRNLAAGALFVALRGEQHHGHEFLAGAKDRGAAAALVEAPGIAPLPAVVVADSRSALGRLGAAWRARFDLPLVGVTGSNGKTTVKEMLATVLGQAGPVLYTSGNLNNDIGVPLTLTRLGAEHAWAVVEMGANHPGEIAHLAALARPRVGIITQCAPAHLEGFGSIEGVARTKGELVAGLTPDGVAVINGDDVYAELWRSLAAPRRCLSFGLEQPADVSARWEPRALSSRLQLRTPAGECELELPVPGRHNVMNALAVTAAALALGLPLHTIAVGLARVRGVKGRLQALPGARGVQVLDDTYNANPGSLAAALEVLGSLSGPRWLVLGDMLELGEAAAEFHRDAGSAARAAGVERLYAVGPLARAAAESFGAGGLHFAAVEALAGALTGAVAPGTTVLVKGSRGMRMERVVAALVGED